MIQLPANISIANAQLPAVYEAAKTALTNCASIDECQDWADKAEALASYAKQADDDSLRKLADRIQARAVRRCGELLKKFRPGPGTRVDLQPRVPGEPRTITEFAMDANLSGRQRKTALRVANIPAETFNGAVESDDPPTVTKLAEMGKQSRAPVPPHMAAPPEGFAQATHLLGAVRRFADFCSQHEPEVVANGVRPHEVVDLRRTVATIDGWLDRFVINLKD